MRATAMAGLAGWVAVTLLGGMSAQAQPSPDLPRLTGIVIAGPQRVAIFDGPPGLTTAVEEGETIATYTVRFIGPAGVQLEREGRRVALTLSQSLQAAAPVDAGGVTFGKVVNPQGPPDD